MYKNHVNWRTVSKITLNQFLYHNAVPRKVFKIFITNFLPNLTWLFGCILYRHTLKIQIKCKNNRFFQVIKMGLLTWVCPKIFSQRPQFIVLIDSYRLLRCRGVILKHNIICPSLELSFFYWLMLNQICNNLLIFFR